MISLSFVTVVTGFYAMNLRNGPWQPNGYQHDFATFYEVTPAGVLLVVWWGRPSRWCATGVRMACAGLLSCYGRTLDDCNSFRTS